MKIIKKIISGCLDHNGLKECPYVYYDAVDGPVCTIDGNYYQPVEQYEGCFHPKCTLEDVELKDAKQN